MGDAKDVRPEDLTDPEVPTIRPMGIPNGDLREATETQSSLPSRSVNQWIDLAQILHAIMVFREW